MKGSPDEPLDDLMPDWLQKLTGAFAPMRAERTSRSERSEAAERAPPPHGDTLRT